MTIEFFKNRAQAEELAAAARKHWPDAAVVRVRIVDLDVAEGCGLKPIADRDYARFPIRNGSVGYVLAGSDDTWFGEAGLTLVSRPADRFDPGTGYGPGGVERGPTRPR